jgi:hypothetical protein
VERLVVCAGARHIAPEEAGAATETGGEFGPGGKGLFFLIRGTKGTLVKVKM